MESGPVTTHQQRRLPQRTVLTRPAGQGRRAILLPVIVAGLALTGCASADRPAPLSAARGSASATASQPTLPASATGARKTAQSASPGSTCAHGSGFALSLASGYPGWATPVQAAQQFSRQPDPGGYGTPSTVWTAGTPTASGVSVTAEHLTLHAVRLPNGHWAIDSGQRCD
jgi:hypothetical protein